MVMNRWVLVCVLLLTVTVAAQVPVEKGKATIVQVSTKKVENKPCYLQGRVVDEHGKPIAEACILHGNLDELCTEDALKSPNVRSDEYGYFEFLLPPMSLKNMQSAYGGIVVAPGRVAKVLSYFAMPGWNPYKVTQKAGTAYVDMGSIVLPPGVTMHGRVRRKDGRALMGVRVVAQDFLQMHGSTMANLSNQFGGYSSFANSDEDGAFRLPGVFPTGVKLEIHAEGFYRQQFPFVSVKEPLLIEMLESGFVEGQVLDAAGKPMYAHVQIRYESSWHESAASTKEDGRFRINLDCPQRYRIVARPMQGILLQVQREIRSAVCQGPIADLQLQEEKRLAHQQLLKLRVLEAESDKAVEKFKAAAFWDVSSAFMMQAQFLDMQFQSSAQENQLPGEISLPGPTAENSGNDGRLMVRAKGFAPLVKDDLSWLEGESNKLEVKLLKESVVSGVVVDAATKEPIVDARVYAKVKAEGVAQQGFFPEIPGMEGEEETIKTDAEGKFRIGSLGKGKYSVLGVCPTGQL